MSGVQALSTIKPDPEDIIVQMQLQLGSKASWTDTLTTAVGETMLEYVGSIGALDQYSIERLWKEMFPQTARLDSSIFAGTRFLGVRLKRKSPASLQATFVNSDSVPVSYPAFTQFSISGYSVFNTTLITVPANGSLPNVYLYEGQVRSANFQATGNDFQAIISNETGFVIDDSNVQIQIDGVVITRVTDGLWNYKVVVLPGSDTVTPLNGNTIFLSHQNLQLNSVSVPGFTLVTSAPASPTQVFVDYVNGSLTFYATGVNPTPINVTYNYSVSGLTDVWQDLTTKDGNLQVQFGNALYGVSPRTGANVILTYPVTQGSLGNDGSVAGLNITYAGQPTTMVITCQSGGLTGGSDQLDSSVYKTLAPQLFAAMGRAVAQQDYNAMAVTYPTLPILDARFQGQRDLDTTNNTFMNLCRVWLLSNVVIQQQDFDYFTKWMTQRGMYALRFYYQDQGVAIPPGGSTWYSLFGIASPAKIKFKISAKVYCLNFADLSEVQNAVQNALIAFTNLKYGSISRDIFVSDIVETILNAHPAVDYVQLISPTTDIITNMSSVVINATPSGAGATFGAGAYQVAVTALFDTPTYPSVNAPYESIGALYSFNIASGSYANIDLSWSPVAGASKYNVYFVANTGGSIMYYNKQVTTNSAVLSGFSLNTNPVLPIMDKSGVRFPFLDYKNDANALIINTAYTKRS